MKKINGPTCKLTLCDIIIENFGIIFTNIHGLWPGELTRFMELMPKKAVHKLA